MPKASQAKVSRSAIIDQPVILEHPEFRGKIAKYVDVGQATADKGSMHGPAITSLLVGENIGTAPDARFIMWQRLPGWKMHNTMQMPWIGSLQKNEKLPEGK